MRSTPSGVPARTFSRPQQHEPSSRKRPERHPRPGARSILMDDTRASGLGPRRTKLALGGRRIISAWPEDRRNPGVRRGAETRGRMRSTYNSPLVVRTSRKRSPGNQQSKEERPRFGGVSRFRATGFPRAARRNSTLSRCSRSPEGAAFLARHRAYPTGSGIDLRVLRRSAAELSLPVLCRTPGVRQGCSPD